MKKPVKVNPFDPIEPGLPMEHYDDGTVKRKSLGVPVRLMMATEIVSGMLANSEVTDKFSNIAKLALAMADELIKQHNEEIERLP